MSKENRIRVVYVEPEKLAKVTMIGTELEDLQQAGRIHRDILSL